MYQHDMDLSLEKLIINKTWLQFISSELKKDYFLLLNDFIKNEYQNKTIYPKAENIFQAINYLDLQKVKVVVLGQDPYHGEGEANGLSFSVPLNVKIPPSLRNIFKELASDLNLKKENGDLSVWQKEGVLLLNTALTVEKDKAGSHQKKGWEQFTDQLISVVSDQCLHVVFILWGSQAHKKDVLINSKKHFIVKEVHPSPLSSYRGFFGSKPFSKSNSWLQSKGIQSVKW